MNKRFSYARYAQRMHIYPRASKSKPYPIPHPRRPIEILVRKILYTRMRDIYILYPSSKWTARCDYSCKRARRACKCIYLYTERVNSALHANERGSAENCSPRRPQSPLSIRVPCGGGGERPGQSN